MSPVIVVVTVVSSGTPVPVIPLDANSYPVWTPAARITFEPLKANAGRSYVGKSTMVVATPVDVIFDIAAPGSGAGGVIDKRTIETQDSSNKLDVSDYFIDGATNEGVRVTYWPS